MKDSFNTKYTPTWCPGCGNYSIHIALKNSFEELKLSPSKVFMSYDIGCNGNGFDTLNTYSFKGLHGRSIPLAVGAHLANRKYTVIADIGDGGCLHEGIDHLIHAIKSNYDITILIHNNQNFALTTGQGTVTSQNRKKVYGQPYGQPERDIDVTNLILSLNPSFFARAFSGDPKILSEIISKGIKHRGCSVIEILQLCPTYNKDFTTEYFKEKHENIKNTEGYDCTDIIKVRNFFNNQQNDRIYTGILIQQTKIPTFYDNLHSRKDVKSELVDEVKRHNIKDILKILNDGN